MKAMICGHCGDILAAYADGDEWRWCRCEHSAVKWFNPSSGQLLVTSIHGKGHVRVLGLSNSFLEPALDGPAGRPGVTWRAPEDWRTLHEQACEVVGPGYLFHTSRRDCWAVVIAPGETSDVQFVSYDDVKSGPKQGPTDPGSSGDRAAVS